MRDTFEFIDAATMNNEDLRHALYDLAAQQIASQAFSLAGQSLTSINATEARKLVETVAGYSGITGRLMRQDSKTRVGERATEILIGLCGNRSGFLRG